MLFLPARWTQRSVSGGLDEEVSPGRGILPDIGVSANAAVIDPVMRERCCHTTQLLGLLDQIEQLAAQLHDRTVTRIEILNGAVCDWPLALGDREILGIEVGEAAEMAARHGAAV